MSTRDPKWPEDFIMRLEPHKPPLMSMIDNIQNKYVRRHWKKCAKKKQISFERVEDDLTPEWLDDDLKPVDFGPYRIIGHHRDVNGVHELMIRDMVNNVDIYLVGIEDERP